MSSRKSLFACSARKEIVLRIEASAPLMWNYMDLLLVTSCPFSERHSFGATVVVVVVGGGVAGTGFTCADKSGLRKMIVVIKCFTSCIIVDFRSMTSVHFTAVDFGGSPHAMPPQSIGQGRWVLGRCNRSSIRNRHGRSARAILALVPPCPWS